MAMMTPKLAATLLPMFSVLWRFGVVGGGLMFSGMVAVVGSGGGASEERKRRIKDRVTWL